MPQFLSHPLLTSPSPSHSWRYRSSRHRRPAFLSVKSSFSGRLDLNAKRESPLVSRLSLFLFWEAGLGILPVGLLAGPKPSLAYATRCAQGRQDRRRHRCDNLHNPLKSFLLRHTLLILMVLALASVSLRRRAR